VSTASIAELWVRAVSDFISAVDNGGGCTAGDESHGAAGRFHRHKRTRDRALGWEFNGMSRIETTAPEYRQYAENYRALARGAQTDLQRTQLLTMADAWDSFAIARDESKNRCRR
jgi:hypothetical protein